VFSLVFVVGNKKIVTMVGDSQSAVFEKKTMREHYLQCGVAALHWAGVLH
jgi:hypothetical protein